ncbi:DNA-binding XRE family transcriptional regulator [Dyadobacter jejuensis]|uniref:DNA-binding XRE family transcriptional regulator n=2 Tax=Dyadobacter jejuensis TaxID=1082580 RepID=A0A316B919_9BACT|nr:DNA-binding XRE family transcriptional regulator [Dyadobacter jejuensis]
MSIVSNNIKYLRRLNGLTQEQFARKIGIKRSLLGAYEEARANPNITNLKNMAASFGVSVDNLLKNDLRRLRETPDTLLPLNVSRQTTVSAHTTTSSTNSATSNRLSVLSEPQPIERVLEKFTPLSPEIRTVSRQINLRPIHGSSTQTVPSSSKGPGPSHAPAHQRMDAPATSIPIFNNQIEPRLAQEAAATSDMRYPRIQWVSLREEAAYLQRHRDATYLSQLPVFQLPNLDQGYYRAFEIGDDFPLKDSILIGTFVGNWYEIKDDENYVLVLQKHGVLYRKVNNKVKRTGSLHLTSEMGYIPPLDVPISEVLEVWAIKAYVSKQLPQPRPSLAKLAALQEEMAAEIKQLNNS